MNRRDLLKIFTASAAVSSIAVESLAYEKNDVIVLINKSAFPLNKEQSAQFIESAKAAFKHDRVVFINSHVDIATIKG
ncbi:MAG: hypothetical protein WC261_07830 [Synergistaceae bacterium]|jgi:hypothetical protein